jgi:hypothetical protein
MNQTVKTVAHAPMKLSEPLLVGMLVMALVACNIAAGSRVTAANPQPGLSLFQTSVAAPAPQALSSIDD